MRRKPGSLVPLELSILAVIARLPAAGPQECHGYEVAKHIAAASERRLLTAYGTLYRALNRLENMGLVESRWEDPQIAAKEARPGRRLYRLTDAGRAAVPRESRHAVRSTATVRKPARA